MLYTRKGDNGTSGLFGTKNRLPKNSPVYEALGTLDELNALLGLCRASACAAGHLAPGVSGEILPELLGIQECLFIIQAELAGAEKSISPEELCQVEETIDFIERLIPAPQGFIIPGATSVSAWCDYARTIARRAERAVISARFVKALSASSMSYLNRLSSLLYSLARYSAALEQTPEHHPSYFKTHN